MKRWLVFIMSALALALGTIAAAFWVRSQFVSDRVVWARVQRQPHASVDWFNINTYRSSLDVSWDRHAYIGRDQEALDPGGPTHLRWTTSVPASLPLPQQPASLGNRAGFVLERWRDEDDENTYERFRLAVPYWAVALPTLSFGTWPFLRIFMRRWEAKRRGFSVSGNHLFSTDVRNRDGASEIGTGLVSSLTPSVQQTPQAESVVTIQSQT